MKFITTLIFLLIFSSLLASDKITGSWYSTDGNYTYEFKFYKNKTYQAKVLNKIAKGTWKAQNNILSIKINGKITKYAFMFKNNYLVLAQSKTSYMILGKNKVDILNLFKKITNKNTNQNSKYLTDKQFIYLLNNYATIPANTVYSYLTRFNKEHKTWIPIYTAWYQMMVFRACQGASAYNTANDKQMCLSAKKSYQSTVYLLKDMPVNMRDPWSKAKSETNKLIIYYKCKHNLLDNYTCKNYIGVQKNINKMHNKTMDTIIEGFKPIPCKEHYEAGTNVYLGCY